MADILIITEAGGHLGFGHLRRTLVLARVLRGHGATVRFELRTATRSLSAFAKERGFECQTFERWDQLVNLETNTPSGGWSMVIDTQQENQRLAQRLKGPSTRITIIDDGVVDIPLADLLINQNLHATSIVTQSLGSSRLFGPRYALLDPLYHEVRRRGYNADGPVVMTFGGTDPTSLSGQWLSALSGVTAPGTLVIGPAFSDPLTLKSRAESLGWQVLQAPGELATILGTAGWVISAAGSTVLELACLGVPAILMAVADNQEPVVAAAVSSGAFLGLGRVDDLSRVDWQSAVQSLKSDHAMRKLMSEKGRALVDGRGAERVAQAILTGGPP